MDRRTDPRPADTQGPFVFPTAEHHPAPGTLPEAAADPAPSEPAIDHGLEETFPASDPVSVSPTKVPPAPRSSGTDEQQAHAAPSVFRAAVRTGLIAGAFASVASTVALALCGRRDAGSAVAPTNAVSHWAWDRKAFVAHSPSWRHTGLGYVIHHGTATFWAVLYAWLHAERRPARSVPAALASAGMAAATACAVDYTITPRRLTPGFEHHLSKGSMAAVYATFAVGLALGCAVAQRGRRR